MFPDFEFRTFPGTLILLVIVVGFFALFFWLVLDMCNRMASYIFSWGGYSSHLVLIYSIFAILMDCYKLSILISDVVVLNFHVQNVVLVMERAWVYHIYTLKNSALWKFIQTYHSLTGARISSSSFVVYCVLWIVLYTSSWAGKAI